jgi:CrcB protein
MTPQLILAVAVGGALAAVARYLVGIGSGKLFGTNFPWGTLIINVTGSFLIGAFVGLFAAKWDVSQTTRVFLTVGICGGYTTFFTFSLDAYYLIERWSLTSPSAKRINGSKNFRSSPQNDFCNNICQKRTWSTRTLRGVAFFVSNTGKNLEAAAPVWLGLRQSRGHARRPDQTSLRG